MSSCKRLRETVELEYNNNKISKRCHYENTSAALLQPHQNIYPSIPTGSITTTSHSLLENIQLTIPPSNHYISNQTKNTLERYFQKSDKCTSRLGTQKEATANSPMFTYSSCVICQSTQGTYYQTCERCCRSVCSFCSRTCDECIGVFCVFCSIVNYEYRFDRIQCMDCQSGC
ncbi:hypothetical protein GpartN1_g5146.t1 [Galdieria partita]|uniref:Apoptosis regulatory protein Siva n=1 Tax=Galdieria partita TaxID=83374 RepID=A0A9C7PZM9_9RHOD|nr:hypothetical protein GpartN1_g2108.t1 [Galdieria partita]GJQ13355.1 hypothetical protein GpartN1_g5146.t1 [Galdieria partita]